MDYQEIETELKDMRKDIRESRYGLLKILGIEAIPFVQGYVLGSLGRVTQTHWIPLIPIVLDGSFSSFSSLRGLWSLSKYVGGTILAYPGVYEGLKNYLGAK